LARDAPSVGRELKRGAFPVALPPSLNCNRPLKAQENWEIKEWARAYFFLMPPDLPDDEEEEREPELWEGLDPREELEIREELELWEGEE